MALEGNYFYFFGTAVENQGSHMQNKKEREQMKKTKKLFISTAAFSALMLLAGTGLMAQGFGHGYGSRGDGPRFSRGSQGGYGYRRGARRQGRGMFFLQKELGLTDAQVDRIFDINNKYHRQAYHLRKKGDFAKLRDLRDAHRKEVESVFTAKQKKRLKELQYSRRCPGPGYGSWGGQW
jgi:Spy/CpxP family protein refolding chaperone